MVSFHPPSLRLFGEILYYFLLKVGTYIFSALNGFLSFLLAYIKLYIVMGFLLTFLYMHIMYLEHIHPFITLYPKEIVEDGKISHVYLLAI
jgi:hypothetical protein